VVSAWLLATPLLASVPQIDGAVVDLADAIVDRQEREIAATLEAHHQRTGVQLAVLVVDTTRGQDIADYAQDVFERWGGGSAERDDGALFVLAVADRRSRLHLGYGLEPVISDAAAKAMLDELRPALQASHFGEAVERLVDDVQRRTSHLRAGEPIAPPSGSAAWLWSLAALVAMAIGYGAGRVVAEHLDWRRPRAEVGPLQRLRQLADDRRLRALALGAAAGYGGLVAVSWHDPGLVLAYSLLVWLSVGLGWVIGGTPRAFGWTFGACMAMTLMLGLRIALDAPDSSWGASLVGEAAVLLLLGAILAACFAAGVYTGWTTPRPVGTVGRSREESSVSSSSASTSYRSSSVSRPSSTPSPRFGASSFGGGSFGRSSFGGGPFGGRGGSSGGGGASSSW
jgi:uncharacterized protein